MTNNLPILDLFVLPTSNSQLMAIGDSSDYPYNFTISSPSIEVTPPAFPKVVLSFVPRNVMIFNSDTLNITSTVDGGCLTDLPDGLYKFKYTIAPAYTYNIEKYFLRVDKLYSKYDDAYLKLDIFQCDGAVKKQDEKVLDDVEEYIQGAIAA